MSRLLNLIRASKAVKEAHSMSRESLLKLQEHRWREMAQYALKVSPFYRRHLAGIDVSRCNLQDIPPITKEILAENWDEIVPDKRLHRAALESYLQDSKNWGKLLHGRWMVSMTSGTTGKALAIPHDIAAVDWVHACNNLRNSSSPHTSSQPRLPLFRKRLKIIAFISHSAPTVSSVLYGCRPWVGSIFCKYQTISITSAWNEIMALR